ncbi:hypothetical protein AMATHDRAFT_80422 [Amanita thiersii Skay4041]|uniref:Cytochrome P450 n=1 Tax=Amanita thiersii Skay4041 TaxID=703135 RepID=A0A2A9NTX8_9AGAR|nr:hypothetical protein AMATHDRAFT_80422 [Amanita thiersii Skay4041]
MPPGPLGLPLIGNWYQLPEVKPWRQFAEWNRQYGPAISFFLGSTPVIVLGTAQAAWDLLEKRSEIYSSRPRFIMGGEILSDNMRGLMLPNNERWRKWRKLLHLGFHARKADTYREIQSLESKVMIQQMLDEPEEYENHLKRFAASVVVSVTYGRRIDTMDEWVVKENMDAMQLLTFFSIPGKYLVESWPWLLKLPRSLQWFRQKAEERRQRDIHFLMHLYNDVKSRMKDETSPDCLTSQAISNRKQISMSELEVAYAVSSPFGAGIETVLKKAQAELDSAIGHDRMPEFSDKDNLPYIQAVVKETLRWRPTAVLGGSPHAVTADDEYNGMFIPKGSTVFANLYGIMRDPEMFPEPDEFKPERFLDASDRRIKDFDLPFGFGRRICPGMHLASNSLFINIARITWGFNILPEPDSHGVPILPDLHNFTDGFNSVPVNFRCRIIPRNQKIVGCIESEWKEAKGRLKSWESELL